MKTLILREPGRLELDDTAEPSDPGPGEVLVRVRRVGVCGTDIHAYRGEQPFFSYPRILGHELGVEVEAVGEGVEAVAIGDRCAVEPYLTCGVCAACTRGRTNCCESLQCLGVHTDGGMRERIVLPAAKLHRSEELGLDALALVETLGIGKHAVDRARLEAGDTVAVIGLGPIGLTAAQFAKIGGARVVGVDISEERIAAADRLLGIEGLRLSRDRSVRDQWADRFGELPRAVFDATGSRASMEGAFELPGQGGTLVFIGLLIGSISFDDPEFHRRELSVLASRNSVGNDFREIIRHIEAGRVDPEAWITHRAAASDWPGVFEGWLDPGAGLLKGVVSFD